MLVYVDGVEIGPVQTAESRQPNKWKTGRPSKTYILSQKYWPVTFSIIW